MYHWFGVNRLFSFNVTYADICIRKKRGILNETPQIRRNPNPNKTQKSENVAIKNPKIRKFYTKIPRNPNSNQTQISYKYGNFWVFIRQIFKIFKFLVILWIFSLVWVEISCCLAVSEPKFHFSLGSNVRTLVLPILLVLILILMHLFVPPFSVNPNICIRFPVWCIRYTMWQIA